MGIKERLRSTLSRHGSEAAGPLPDFVIIGVQKAGTTSLSTNLGKHPQVFMPRREVHFFDSHWDEGVEWYRAKFAAGRGKICGEKSPRYITRRVWMKRLHDVVPDAKIVVLLRDPVSRLFSQLNMDIQRDRVPPCDAIDAAYLKEHVLAVPGRVRNYVGRGRYLEQLEGNVLPFFPRERIFIRATDGWHSSADRSVFTQRDTPYQVSGVEQGDFSRQLLFDLEDFLEVERWDPPSMDVAHVRSYRSEATADAKELIRDLFRPENERLFTFLGYEIPEWNKAPDR